MDFDFGTISKKRQEKSSSLNLGQSFYKKELLEYLQSLVGRSYQANDVFDISWTANPTVKLIFNERDFQFAMLTSMWIDNRQIYETIEKFKNLYGLCQSLNIQNMECYSIDRYDSYDRSREKALKPYVLIKNLTLLLLQTKVPKVIFENLDFGHFVYNLFQAITELNKAMEFRKDSIDIDTLIIRTRHIENREKFKKDKNLNMFLPMFFGITVDDLRYTKEYDPSSKAWISTGDYIKPNYSLNPILSATRIFIEPLSSN